MLSEMNFAEMVAVFVATLFSLFCFMMVGASIEEKRMTKSCHKYHEEMPLKDAHNRCNQILGKSM